MTLDPTADRPGFKADRQKYQDILCDSAEAVSDHIEMAKAVCQHHFGHDEEGTVLTILAALHNMMGTDPIVVPIDPGDLDGVGGGPE